MFLNILRVQSSDALDYELALEQVGPYLTAGTGVSRGGTLGERGGRVGVTGHRRRSSSQSTGWLIGEAEGRAPNRPMPVQGGQFQCNPLTRRKRKKPSEHVVIWTVSVPGLIMVERKSVACVLLRLFNPF